LSDPAPTLPCEAPTLDPGHGTGWVRVDLKALGANYRRLAALAAPSRCAATVKADAYGLGLEAVVTRLAAEGCDTFFVANVGEGVTARALVPHAQIFVFNGVMSHDAEQMLASGLTPVLNCADQVHCWSRYAALVGRPLPCAIHLDTGMNRLGMAGEEVERLVAEPDWHLGLDVRLVMTHLACAHHRGDPLTSQQVRDFKRLSRLLPDAPTSIGNSAGTLLGASTRGDLVRPGIALYGGHPFDYGDNPLQEVVRVYGRVIQLREVGQQHSVGYGGTYRAETGQRLATVGVGYADGYRRELGNRALAGAAGRRVPVVGRVSMDLLTLDVTAVPAQRLQPGDSVELIGGAVSLEEVAHAAGTVGYELLTGLGDRLTRVYVE
jgi:alanine racemase